MSAKRVNIAKQIISNNLYLVTERLTKISNKN